MLEFCLQKLQTLNNKQIVWFNFLGAEKIKPLGLTNPKATNLKVKDPKKKKKKQEERQRTLTQFCITIFTWPCNSSYYDLMIIICRNAWIKLFAESTWEMNPPSLIPSKNWWKLNAAIRGLNCFGLWEAPSDTPITTEWITIPYSRTCAFLYFHLLVYEVKKVFLFSFLIKIIKENCIYAWSKTK